MKSIKDIDYVTRNRNPPLPAQRHICTRPHLVATTLEIASGAPPNRAAKWTLRSKKCNDIGTAIMLIDAPDAPGANHHDHCRQAEPKNRLHYYSIQYFVVRSKFASRTPYVPLLTMLLRVQAIACDRPLPLYSASLTSQRELRTEYVIMASQPVP